MHIDKVVSNVKKGTNINLSPRTLIVGKNGSGKSTITQSIELAMGGFVTDLVGRDMVKRSSDLMVLSNDGKTLESTAHHSEGGKSTYHATTDESGGVKRGVRKGLKARFVFQEVENHLTGSAAKAQSWLLTQVNLNRAEVMKSLGEDYTDLYETITDSLGNLNEVELLQQATQNQKEVLKGYKPRMEELQVLIDQVSRAGEAVKRDDSVANRKTDMEDARKHLQALIADKARLKEANNHIYTAYELGAYMRQIQEEEVAFTKAFDAMKQEASKALGSESGQSKMVLALLESAFVALSAQHQCSTFNPRLGEECVTCGEGKFQPSLEGRLEQIRGQIIQYRSIQTSENIENPLPELERWEAKIAKMKEVAKLMRESVGEKVDLTRHDDAIQQTRQGILTLEAIARSKEESYNRYDQIISYKKRIEELEGKKRFVHSFIKACQRTIKEAVTHICAAFSHRVSQYLPPSDIFELKIVGERCIFGLKRKAKLYQGLSGAEWVKVILAIGAATSSTEDFNVYMPSERAYDSKTLKEMMLAFGDYQGQVILTTPAATFKRVKGWKIINLDKDQVVIVQPKEGQDETYA